MLPEGRGGRRVGRREADAGDALQRLRQLSVLPQGWGPAVCVCARAHHACGAECAGRVRAESQKPPPVAAFRGFLELLEPLPLLAQPRGHLPLQPLHLPLDLPPPPPPHRPHQTTKENGA